MDKIKEKKNKDKIKKNRKGVATACIVERFDSPTLVKQSFVT